VCYKYRENKVSAVGRVFAGLCFLPLLSVVAVRYMEDVAGSSVEKEVMSTDPDFRKPIAKYHKQLSSVEKKVMLTDPDFRKAIAKYHKQVLESDVSKSNSLCLLRLYMHLQLAFFFFVCLFFFFFFNNTRGLLF
jgi:hypothetical protein